MTSLPPVHVMLPCRAGSKRITNKNTRLFSGVEGGLTGLKLAQLARCSGVASLTVTTDDPLVMEIAGQYRPQFTYPLNVIPRPYELAISDSLDKFVAYIPEIIPDGVVFWTHVTSPFFGISEIEGAISTYHREVTHGDYDSLMGVQKIQTFLWDNKGCISHDRTAIKWPQTQDLEPIYEVTSSVFMIDRALMIDTQDRIGDRPFLYQSSQLANFDIDWPEDFELAERIYGMGSAEVA